MVVMMDMEISCKGHCEKSSHFIDHVSHTVYASIAISASLINVPNVSSIRSDFKV